MEANDQHLHFKLLSVNTFILKALQTDSDVCMKMIFGKCYLLAPSAYHNCSQLGHAKCYSMYKQIYFHFHMWLSEMQSKLPTPN